MSRRRRLSIWRVLDNIAIATGTTACFIRLGNLMNSEIIGKVTDVPWAFIFERVDLMPRHPGQLYEAIAYGILFFLMWWLHKKMPQKIGTGWYFGLCLTYIFTFRFFIEYTKEIQEAFEGFATHRYGTDTLHTFRDYWCGVYAKSQETINKCHLLYDRWHLFFYTCILFS